MSVSIDGTGSLIGVDQGLNIVGLTTLTGGIILDDSISHIGDTDTKIRFPAADTFTVETAGSERLRIASDGNITLGYAGNSLYFQNGFNNRASRIQNGGTSGSADLKFYTNYAGTEAEALRIDSAGRLLCGTSSGSGEPIAAFQGRSNDASDSGIVAITRTGTNPSGSIGELRFATGSDFNKYYAMVICQSDGSTTSTSLPGVLRFSTTASGSTSPTERMRITSGGIIKCGTSATLKAEINNAVSGHQFISQCSDNNNGFEVYQQHASNTTRNTLAVYANTGSGNAKDLQFSVRGDGCVTKPNNPAFLAGRTGGNQTFTVGTFPLNLTRINVGNCWNTSTYKFTAPVAGIYYFFASVYYNDGAGQHRIHFRKTPNGGTAFQLCTVSHQAASNDDSKSMSIVESMAVGDTMELYSDQNAAVQCYYNLNNTTYGAHTYMMGYLIG